MFCDSKDKKDVDFEIFGWGPADQTLPRQVHVPYWKWKGGGNGSIVVKPLLDVAEAKLLSLEKDFLNLKDSTAFTHLTLRLSNTSETTSRSLCFRFFFFVTQVWGQVRGMGPDFHCTRAVTRDCSRCAIAQFSWC